MSTILAAYTILHVAISLIAILAGTVMVNGMLSGRRLDRWITIFLWMTVATSVTGFFFPVHHFMPSHGVGIISLLILPIAIYGFYKRQLAGAWRWIFVITAMIGFYLNFFVLVVQSFLKIPALKSLAPTQTESPFKLTQLVVLVIFIAATVLAGIRFRPREAAVM